MVVVVGGGRCRQGGAQEGKGEGSRLGGRSGRVCLVCTGPGFHTQNTDKTLRRGTWDMKGTWEKMRRGSSGAVFRVLGR